MRLSQFKGLQKQTETMLNRLSRVNTDNLTPEEFTRYEELVSNAEVQLKNINLVNESQNQILKSLLVEKKLEAAGVTANELQELIANNDTNTNQKISRGVKYIQSVLSDADVLATSPDLTSLQQTVTEATEYLSTL
jgi:hypothetical protein